MTYPTDRAVILLVDDDPLSTLLLTPLLKDIGADVLTATTGEEALDLVERADLLLLDISLPGMDGHEFAARTRERLGPSAPPIVYITSHRESTEKVRAFESGASEYITKPFDFDEVRVRVNNQLRLLRLQSEVAGRNRDLERQNEELRLALEQIREKEEQLSESRHELMETARFLVDSRKSVERIFSTLSGILPGTVLDNRYKLETLIQAGGFGSVYRGTHLVLDRPVAVKVLHPPEGPDAEAQLERFRIEAMSGYKFRHPNAVSVLDAGVSSRGLPYIVMELLEGSSLRDELQRHGRMTLKRCAEIVAPVCDVLDQAHRSGVTHRDIKPDNIYLDRANGREIVKVLDFGLAGLHRSGEYSARPDAAPRFIVGTPEYMAPELFAGAVIDATKTDVYAVAVVTYEALAGRLPFPPGPGGIAALVSQHLSAPVPAIREFAPELPTSVHELLLEGLDKSPDPRPSVRTFMERLIIAALSDDEAFSEQDQETLRIKTLADD